MELDSMITFEEEIEIIDRLLSQLNSSSIVTPSDETEMIVLKEALEDLRQKCIH